MEDIVIRVDASVMWLLVGAGIGHLVGLLLFGLWLEWDHRRLGEKLVENWLKLGVAFRQKEAYNIDTSDGRSDSKKENENVYYHNIHERRKAREQARQDHAEADVRVDRLRG